MSQLETIENILRESDDNNDNKVDFPEFEESIQEMNIQDVKYNERKYLQKLFSFLFHIKCLKYHKHKPKSIVSANSNNTAIPNGDNDKGNNENDDNENDDNENDDSETIKYTPYELYKHKSNKELGINFIINEIKMHILINWIAAKDHNVNHETKNQKPVEKTVMDSDASYHHDGQKKANSDSNHNRDNDESVNNNITDVKTMVENYDKYDASTLFSRCLNEMYALYKTGKYKVIKTRKRLHEKKEENNNQNNMKKMQRRLRSMINVMPTPTNPSHSYSYSSQLSKLSYVQPSFAHDSLTISEKNNFSNYSNQLKSPTSSENKITNNLPSMLQRQYSLNSISSLSRSSIPPATPHASFGYTNDNSIVVDLSEKQKHIQSLLSRVKRVLEEIDEDNNGHLDFEDFLAFLKEYRLQEKFTHNELILIFNVLVMKTNEFHKNDKEELGSIVIHSSSSDNDESKSSVNHFSFASQINENHEDTENKNKHTEISITLLIEAIRATLIKSPGIGIRRAIFRMCKRGCKYVKKSKKEENENEENDQNTTK